MEYIMIGLLALSLILFILSAFLKDPYKDIRDEIDQLSIKQIEELYQIKKKLRVLEEELLVSDEAFHDPFPVRSSSAVQEKKEIHEIIKNQVSLLSEQGLSIEQIARQSSLSPDEVQSILTEMMFRGNKYE